MAVRDLFVQVDEGLGTRARLNATWALAECFGAHVTAFFVIAEPFMRGGAGHHMPTEVVRAHLSRVEADAEAVFAAAREEANRRGIGLETRHEAGSLDRLPGILARNARNADLVIVGEPNPERRGADETLLVESAFMDTGRPALVVPEGGAREMPPKRVIVAWDGSREAARAVHDALPLLSLAEDVIILIVDPEKLGPRFGQQPGAGVQTHLVRHGVRARVKQVASGGTAIAELILAQANEEGSDLIVMGGYGHSRLREMMIGGATRHMLERMTLPVLFAH